MPHRSVLPALRRAVVIALGVAGVVGPARRAAATTTLNVDLGTSLGPVTHAASGSLYGVTETLPADVTTLIGPLHPYVFNNPAADQQQPVGDAIVVAGRLAPVGGKVSIRLADWLKGFYTFTSMSDWLSKIDMTAARRKSANLTNIYGYEIWNEPQGTYASSNPLSFNDFWAQTYAELRKVDPTIKIIGPSTSYYNNSYMQGFLQYCKTNNVVPDIISWHQLSGSNFTSDVQTYRSLEKSLGIGPLPISINEYSGAADLSVEGQPGASAPLIAKFERFRVDSACISYWDVAHPGRLGSLLASNTQTNGGWWFYKWYGDMAGNMVSTTPPTPSSPSALDGFANLDASGRSASVLFGGTNDGTVAVVVKGFAAAGIFGGSVHVVVEHTPFVDRTTVVTATTTLSTSDVTVANDQLTLTVSGTNNTDGYRVVLTPIGGGAGGSGGSGGGGSGGGGAVGSGGRGGAGGATGAGGTTGSGGAGGRAGSNGAAGSGAGGRSGSGGSASGGSNASGGATGSGGVSATAGATGSGGSASGGATGTGGSSTGTGGTVTGTGGDAGASSGGCSCELGGRPSGGAASWILSLFAAALCRRRGRGRSSRAL
ncbi:MAG TPA: hypothetical protein VGP64_12290 [Polyangia bacterium]